MNIFKKYTLRNLKKNKTRTIITIIGIILSVSMFTATIESFVTVQNLLLDYTKMTTGSYHVSFHDINPSDMGRITADKRVTDYTVAKSLGYSECESLNEAKPYIHIYAVPSDYNDVAAINLTSGRLPEKSSEIVISEHIMTNGGADINIGDTLSLSVGQRQWNELIGISPEEYELLGGDNRQKLTQEATFKDDEETLINTKEAQYTVVGICARPDYTLEPYSAPGYTAFTLDEEGTSGIGTLFCTLEKAAQYEMFMKNYGVSGGTVKKNTNLLMFSLVLHDNAFEGMFFGMGAVLIGIIVFGSVALIFNSFSISLSERTKQYGLLKSIGATKKQIMSSVLFEATVLCLAAIPLGLIFGCLGISITFKGLGGVITNLLSQFKGLNIRFILSPVALISSSILSILTVILSAYIPAKRAVKINPVDAIRQNKDIKIKRKAVRISPLTQKLFGLSGIISAKSFKRNRKKYSVTVFSLFVSVVMFISASSLASYFTTAMELEAEDRQFDISIYEDAAKDLTAEEKADFIKLVSKTYADSYALNQSVYKRLGIADTLISDDYMKHYEVDDENKSQLTEGDIDICFINDECFKEQLKSLGLDESDYFNKNAPKALLYDNIRLIKNNKDGKQMLYTFTLFKETSGAFSFSAKETLSFPTFFIESIYEENGITYYLYRKAGNEGDDLSKNETKLLTESEAVKNYTVDIGAVIKEKPYYTSGMTNIIYPESMLEYTPFKDNSFTLDAFFISKNHRETEKQLQTGLHQTGLADNFSCYNYASDMETIRGLVIIAKVLAYGFIVLISLIAAANVFNTISTNIALRQREFATLRSIGLTQQGLYRIMIYESLLYGIKSLAFSLPVSTLITVLIYFIVKESGYIINFYIPVGTFITAILSVFIIVFLSMFYSVRKIRNSNVIDALRTENI